MAAALFSAAMSTIDEISRLSGWSGRGLRVCVLSPLLACAARLCR
jgi:hypothetical protein